MTNRKSNSERKCSFCGQVGHYRSTCPKIKERSSPIAVQNDEDEEISQFSPNKHASPPKPAVQRILRPRTRSSAAAPSTTVIDTSNDSDFQPSSNSASDLPDILDTQEAEDLVATLDEILKSPPKDQVKKKKKKKKRSSNKKNKQPKKASSAAPPRRVLTPNNGPRSAYPPLQMQKVQNPAMMTQPRHPFQNAKIQQGRPLLPMTTLNQRWYPPPPRRSPHFSNQFTGTSSFQPRPLGTNFRQTAFSNGLTPNVYASSSAKYVPPSRKYIPPQPPQTVTPPASVIPPKIVAPPLPPPIKHVTFRDAAPAPNHVPRPLKTPRPPQLIPNPRTQPQTPAEPTVQQTIETPDENELMQLQQLGLNMLFGVSHESGGGIYLSRREATVAAVRFHNEGHTVAKIKPFQRSDIPLSRLESLVEAWVRLSQPVPNSPDNFFPGTHESQNAATPSAPNTSTPTGECPPTQTISHTPPPSHNPQNLPPLLPNPHSNLHSHNPLLHNPNQSVSYDPRQCCAHAPMFQHATANTHVTPNYASQMPYTTAQHVGSQQTHTTPYAQTAFITAPQHQQHTHYHPPTLPTPSTPEFRSPTEWAFSQNDVTFAKQLMQQGSSPLREMEKAPDPATLVYLAPPGTCKGIFTDNKILSGGHSVEFDPATGSLRMKPKATATLPLMPFTKLLNLIYRTIDSAAAVTTPLFTSVVQRLQRLIRMLIRQHGSLTAAGYPASLPQMMAYLQCTCMARTRVLFFGSSAEAAFEKEASRRLQMGTTTLAAASPFKSISVSSENWKICPCCGLVNDHISTACPTQANGPSKTPAYTRAAVKAAIAAAPITPTARENLSKMCSALWAKIEREL